MNREWKVGDAYTTKEWENLRILGRITAIGINGHVKGAEVWFVSLDEIQFRTGLWRNEKDIVFLTPLRDPMERTITEIYETVEKVQGPRIVEAE